MTDIKFSLRWAFIGLFLALIAFVFNYNMHPINIPAYELLAGPAMIALMPFSEETPFWPKLSIFLSGQYIFYVAAIYIIRKSIKMFFNKKQSDIA